MNKVENTRSKTMKAIRGKNTKLEKRVAQALWANGIRYRKNVSDLFGKPDFAIKKYRVVIFIDSCFWHFCPEHTRLPKNNVDFWIEKLKRNKHRDQEVTKYYEHKGWNIVRIWEHQLNEDFDNTIRDLVRFIKKAKSSY